MEQLRRTAVALVLAEQPTHELPLLAAEALAGHGGTGFPPAQRRNRLTPAVEQQMREAAIALLRASPDVPRP